jgi:hypothetical protein
MMSKLLNKDAVSQFFRQRKPTMVAGAGENIDM